MNKLANYFNFPLTLIEIIQLYDSKYINKLIQIFID
jgi:hypothetical protein